MRCPASASALADTGGLASPLAIAPLVLLIGGGIFRGRAPAPLPHSKEFIEEAGAARRTGPARFEYTDRAAVANHLLSQRRRLRQSEDGQILVRQPLRSRTPQNPGTDLLRLGNARCG